MKKPNELKLVVKDLSNAEEVVDSFADLFEIADIVEDQLADGWQFTDLLAGLQVAPIAAEIKNDIPTFVTQITKMDPALAKDAIREARKRLIQRRGKKVGPVVNYVSKACFALASNYGTIAAIYLASREEYFTWQKVIGNAPIFEDELEA